MTKRETPPRKIAFINEKGGTCKTTLAVNLGAWLARHKGKRVLLIDLDSQGHCGKSLGVDVRSAKRTTFDLLVDPAASVESVAVPTAVQNLWLVPGNKALADFPVRVASDADRARKLDRKLESCGAFDYVLFDAPPSSGLTTENIFLAAREVVIPVALTYLALDGCAEIMATVQRVNAEHKDLGLTVTLVVPTLYRRTALADEILKKLSAYFPDELCETALGYSVRIDEAQSHGRTIWEYAPSCRGAQMLEAIGKDLLARGERQRRRAAS